jgi:hypothetical protein
MRQIAAGAIHSVNLSMGPFRVGHVHSFKLSPVVGVVSRTLMSAQEELSLDIPKHLLDKADRHIPTLAPASSIVPR